MMNSIGLCKHYICDNDNFDEQCFKEFGGDVKDGLTRKKQEINLVVLYLNKG